MFTHGQAFSGFAVPDIRAAKDFYRDVLELIVDEEDGMLFVHVGGPARVLVYPKPDHEPATYTVLNLPVADVEEAVAELTKRGVQFEIYRDGPVKTDERGICRNDSDMGPRRVAWFRDPAGNIISLLESDEAELSTTSAEG